MNRRHQPGFTLIELSVVLVVIGLVVGGVLVGRDLINAAELRSTISQVQSFQTAEYTFENKYNAMPGDLTPGQATQLGFFSRPGGVGNGDGNGRIDDYSGGGGGSSLRFGGENHFFWTDLSAAGLMAGAFADSTTGAITANTDAQIKAEVPEAKIGRGNYFHVIYTRNVSYGQRYLLHQITCIGCNGAGQGTLGNALTPTEAFNIDSKIDDGNPIQGSVLATDAYPFGFVMATTIIVGQSAGPAAFPSSCFLSSPAQYSTSLSTQANQLSCGLAFKLQ